MDQMLIDAAHGTTFASLTDSNKVETRVMQDGYNGHTAIVSVHNVDGVQWVKTAHGCYRDRM